MPEERDDEIVTRVRSALAPRWRSYVPGILLLASGVVVIAASDATRLFGFGERGSRTVLAALLVLASTGIVALVRRPPLWTLLAGALALSVGANVLAPRIVALPVALTGLAWIAGLETYRALDGVALTGSAVVLPRPLRRPLRVPYDALRAVHLTSDRSGTSSIILETEDGTLAVPAVRGAHAIVARIEARRARVPVEATPDSVASSRARIEDILGTGSP